MVLVGGDLVTLLSFDGGKNVGFALFDDYGGEIERGVIDFDDFFKSFQAHHEVAVYFHDTLIDDLVVEGFRHDPTVKQGGSLHWASQVEGAVKLLGAVTDTPVYVQYAGTALPVAKQITGYTGDLTKTGNKKHLPDQDSAWLHGIYWLHCHEVI